LWAIWPETRLGEESRCAVGGETYKGGGSTTMCKIEAKERAWLNGRGHHLGKGSSKSPRRCAILWGKGGEAFHTRKVETKRVCGKTKKSVVEGA